MGVQRFLFAVLLSGAVLIGQTSLFGQTGDGLEWAQQAIDSHAVTHYFDPPARRSDTKWKVLKLEGCQAELQQTWHRESRDGVVNPNGIFGLSEDKTVTYAFDLHELKPEEIYADTSTGLAHLKIFAHGDLFHLTTASVTHTLRADGSVAGTENWSVPGHTSNLWMYFDAPDVDNKAVVQRVAVELQDAAGKCAPPPVARRKRSPKSVIAAALR